jgi:phosphopantothenoylcysteine decarboxylase/phosphopantothenate--cysteine ligase
MNPNLIVLGVTGCIAAYKSAELLRLLQKQDYEVQVVLTEHAQNFVTPMNLAALSRRRVITTLYQQEQQAEGPQEVAIEHVQLPQAASALVVAPATANCLAKFAGGIADDFLSTLYLATTGPVIVAPAMNVHMWNHPAVKENVGRLRSRGVILVDPEEGYLAEGIEGKGRMADLETIVSAVVKAARGAQDLAEETVLVTAGPTCEDIDPVRYLSNRSSGKMGYEIASAAQARGATTLLVSGPTQLSPPAGVRCLRVRSAEEMRSQVLRHFSAATVVIKAAAVADFKPASRSGQKLKKGQAPTHLSLVPTPDILAELSSHKHSQILVGFAAETERVLENARRKLAAKSLDLLVVNDVTQEGAGFDGDTNVVTMLTDKGSEIPLGKRSKRAIAHAILDQVVALKKRHA